MTENTKYYTCAETATLIREALAKKWKKVKFSVRSKTYSGGASITVRYQDGPLPQRVEEVVNKFSGSTFDGMQDLKTTVYHRDSKTGQRIRYGADHIFVHRSYSVEHLIQLVEKVAKQFGIPVPSVVEKYDGAEVVDGHYIHPAGEQSRDIYFYIKRTEEEMNTKPEKQAKPVDAVARASSFRQLAEKMQPAIDEKRRPRNWNVTARRARMDESRLDDARKLELIQSKLIALAEAWETNTCPPELVTITTKSQVEWLAVYDFFPHERNTGYKAIIAAGITPGIYTSTRQALLELGDQNAGKKTATDEIAELEREALLHKIPGFFPTPESVIYKMLRLAHLDTDYLTILEPSAGKGDIADAILTYTIGRHPQLSVIEWNYNLSQILKLKGHTLVGNDFLEHQEKYDRILMNPPFENLQDIDHVRHAYECLYPGGLLIAIMSESPFFRSDKKAVEFRDWLEYEVDGWSEKLPAGSFLESEKSTGVATRIVTISKPEAQPEVIEQPAPVTDPLPEPETVETLYQMSLFGQPKRVGTTSLSPRAQEMFTASQVLHFGATAHPYLPISDYTRLALISPDPRTPQQVEADTQAEAEANNLQLPDEE